MLFLLYCAYHDHLEVLCVSGSANHRPMDRCVRPVEALGNGDAVLVGGDGIPHQEPVHPCVEDEHEAMTASEEHETGLVAIVELQGEGVVRDTIRGLHGWYEQDLVEITVEETKEGRVAAVVEAEAAEESRVGDEAAPALADEGGAWKGGGLRREAEEDLGEEVVVLQRRRRRRAGSAAGAGHLALLGAHGDAVESN